MNIIEPIINRHAAWVVVNSIQGCLNGCSYCFLQRFNSANAAPQIYEDVNTTIELLLKSNYYTEDVPVCLFTSTDIFSTNANIEYLSELLKGIDRIGMPNPIILVTKCKITNTIIDLLLSMKTDIVVYISYSGLPNRLEKNININDVKLNFVTLKEAKIKTVHYFRPITPLNSDLREIDNVLRFVSRYCDASVISGLKVCEEYQEKLDFWPEVKGDPSAINAECIWPQDAQERIIMIAKKYNHLVFETNSCALAYTLGRTDDYGFYGTDWCKKNICSKTQMNNCRLYAEKRKEERKISEVIEILSKFDKDKFTNSNVSICNNLLYLNGLSLANEDICHLSYLLKMQIRVDSIIPGYYWSTSVNGIGGKIYGKN